MDEKIILISEGELLEIQPKNNPTEEDVQKKSIETINELLEAENIAFIIYIDDKFDIQGQKEEFVGRMKNLKNKQKYINEGLFLDFNWDGPEKLIDKLWDESGQKEALLSTVCKFDEDGNNPNIIPALEIKTFFKDKIVPMTPDQWIEDDYSKLKALDSDKKALCLFDFEFQHGKRLVDGKNGAQLAQMLLEQDDIKEKIVCGIFSHKFREEEEDEVRLRYSTGYGIDKTKFYALSKFRYFFDPMIVGFSEGIKSLLLHPHVENLKQESKNILKESNERAWQRIDNITPKTFNQIIQKSSLTEGVWEINTLFRLYGIVSNEEIFNMISSPEIRKKFNSSIERIRSIDKTKTGYTSKVLNEQLINLRNSELYLARDLVNKLHLPISNGDIFNIKNKDYILLVQPCNLAIRAAGRECGLRSRNYNNAFLIPLREFDRNELNHTKEEVFVSENDSNRVLCAYFPDFKVLPLDFLDLTVFNEHGKAFIDMNIIELDNEVIHFPWRKRYSYIVDNLALIENKINSFYYIKSKLDPKIEEMKAVIRKKTKDFKNLGKDEKDKIIEELKPIKSQVKTLEDHLKSVEESIISFDSFESFKLNKMDNYNSDHCCPIKIAQLLN